MKQSVTDRIDAASSPPGINSCQIEKITLDLMKTMLGMNAVVCQESSQNQLVAEGSLHATINIEGDWNANVNVAVTDQLARTITDAMYMTPKQDLSDDDLIDAVGEAVNIIGGNVKGFVGQTCSLGLPIVKKLCGLPPDSSSVVSFSADGEKFLVWVSESASNS